MSDFAPAGYTLSLFTCLLLGSFYVVAEDLSAEDIALDNVYITGGKDSISRKPGSATLMDDVALEVFEYTDIHRVLNAVPGVNIQEEDGYGLRPNIGLRGTSPERSKKITVMEDGILSGPAPYSAPPAYYFPNISRMNGVEVFKGPSTIQYGPATVGGAVNLVSRAIPYAAKGELDAQYGSENFQRYNAYYGEQLGNFGYLIEGLRVSSDGFKELKGGSNTGFIRNDVNLKTSWQVLGEMSHLFQLKLGYADEDSNETYLGLTREDFNDKPNRRYKASQLDNSQWTHEQFQFSHQLEIDNIIVSSDVYRNNFTRDWFKLNDFRNTSVSLQDVLENSSAYQNYYDVLTAEAVSTSGSELLIGNNGRTYVSQGIQTRINTLIDWGKLSHELEVGLHFHQDEVNRLHTEQDYLMLTTGNLQAVAGTYKTTLENEGESNAIAVYVQDEISFSDTTVTLGVRHENITMNKTTYGNTTGVKEQKDTLKQSVFLPGIGFYSQLSNDLGILAGVYKGFTAATPGGSGSIEPELSTNYELGTRFSGTLALGGQAEVIGFVNDYSQFSGTCSFAQGSCDSSAAGEQANAGSAIVAGLEAGWTNEFELAFFRLPMSVSYTFSYGEFKEDFVDSSGAFGEKDLNIKQGYRIGYLPEHRLNVQVGIVRNDWQWNASALYQSEMRNIPGEGSIPKEELIEAHMVLDISANYQLLSDLQLYTAIDNLLDEKYVAGVKPYGFRPGKPRSVNIGAKYQF